MLIHRRNLIESTRPELILINWTRRKADDKSPEFFRFESIRNVGRGVAQHIQVSLLSEIVDTPTVILTTTRLPFLAVNESAMVNADIVVWWQNVSGDAPKHVPIPVSIICRDSRDRVYETRLYLLAVELGGTVIGVGSEQVVDGLVIFNRITSSSSTRWFKWRRKYFDRLHQVPGRAWQSIRSGSQNLYSFINKGKR